MSRLIAFVSILAFGLAAVSAQADNYKIDGSHTSVVFKINHLGFAHIYGQFADVSGSFVIDEAAPEKSSFDLVIKTDSLITHAPKRDQHLRSPDFFNTKQFPKITYKSKSVKKLDGSKYELTGDFTMLGVTKPLTVVFQRLRTGKDPWGMTRTGGDASFKIKRSDFGMNFMQGENQLADEVEVFVSLEGIKQ